CRIRTPQASLCEGIANRTVALGFFDESLHELGSCGPTFWSRDGVLNDRVAALQYTRAGKPVRIEAEHVRVLRIGIGAPGAEDFDGSGGSPRHANDLCGLQVSRAEEIWCAALRDRDLDAALVGCFDALHLRAGWHKIGVVNHHVRRRKLDIPRSGRVE